MLNKIKKSVVILALLAVSITFTTVSASAYMLNWGFDPNGGGDSIITIGENLDLVGTAHINNDFLNNSFTETGFFNILSHDDGTVLPFALHAAFTASGSLALGSFTFGPTVNSLVVYDYLNNEVGKFDLISGGGALNNDYGPSNGDITANFVATVLTPNYWFDALGNDLSLAPSWAITLGFATTNASIKTGKDFPIVMEDEKFKDFYLSNGGQFKLDHVVPEPATMLLLGFGLIGLAGISRKKSHKE